MIASLLHLHVVAATPHDHDMLDGGRRRDGFVGSGLEREDVTSSIPTVRSDQHLGLSVVDAVRQRLSAETAEHHAVHGADACAGQHRHSGLGDHREVDVDPIPTLHSELLQGVGESLHLVEEVGVREHPRIARLALPIERHLVAASSFDMAVEAVVADVELTADEPLGERQLPFANGVPFGGPRQQVGGLACPETLVVLGGVVVQPGVSHQCVALEVGRGRELAVLQHQVVDGVVDVAHVVTPTGHVSETPSERIRSD